MGMNPINVIILLLTYTVFIKYVSSLDQCQNHEIRVHGLTSTLMTPVFATVSSLYENERVKYGRRVSLSVKTVSSTTLRGALTVPISNTTPKVIFTVNTGNTKSNVSNEVRFPMTASGLVIIYNLPEYDQLTLSLSNIASIYKGNSVYWNSSNIAKTNPNATLPFKEILPIARIDNDPSTTLFTQVLSANNADWRKKFGIIYDPVFVGGVCCNSTKWPPDAIFMYANQTVGMVGLVASIPYTVGYATLPSLSQFSVNKAKLTSKISTDVQPSVESIQAAMQFYFGNSDPNELLLKLETANDSEAYPMSAFTYLVLNRTYSDIDCCEIEEMVGFFHWFFFDFNENNLINLDFVPLIPELKERIRLLAIENIKCNDELMYPRYMASKVIPISNALGSTNEVAIISALACSTVLLAGMLLVYYYIRKHQSDESKWLIQKSLVNVDLDAANALYTQKNSTSSVSKVNDPPSIEDSLKSDKVSIIDKSISSHTNHHSEHLKERMIIAEMGSRKVFLHKLNCSPPNQWRKATKRWLTRIRNSTCKNVSTFLGVVEFNNVACAVFEYCSKGTLHYVLTTTTYNITDAIKYQLAIDVTQGMKYLHDLGVTHGRLNSLTCYLDSTWTVKVAQWEQIPLYINEKPTQIIEMTTFHLNTELNDEQLIELIYISPTLRRRRVPVVDVYSFGLLLIEIFTQKIPFAHEIEDKTITFAELLTQKFHLNYNIVPKIKNMPATVGGMSKICTGIESNRPTFYMLGAQLKKMIKISTGIVDIIMDTLEQHAKMLEEKVEERTSELKSVTSKMRVLLYEILPPQIADKLFNGEPVPPEYYECVTIYFSDIVGFTDISARSTPIDVMTFLNDLWIAFDSIIDKFDVYKVDTIGDAFMVASGLPIRNGVNHCKEIALLALALLNKCARFKIKHLTNENIKIRIGINSGPVTAGVVGFKMPQYCVFGDTVNTASRMESTSEEQKIQVSDRTYQMISYHFADKFIFEKRGSLEIKQKEEMKSYWLIGKNERT